MNQGGEPGHGDDGLPRVDIQIPDDARELYRDVQAYHRELRAMRRHERSLRWRAPFRRTGLVVPLIAGCLVTAMFASMVLTMFSANSRFSGIAGRDPGRRAASVRAAPPATGTAAAAPSQTAGSPLPVQTISVAGKPLTLSGLKSIALAIVPAGCRCAAVIGDLVTQARSAGVTVYLVGPRGSKAQLNSLAAAGTAGMTVVAIDAKKVLYTTYKPIGLTILLVDSHGSVTVAPGLRAGFQLEAQLRSLKQAG